MSASHVSPGIIPEISLISASRRSSMLLSTLTRPIASSLSSWAKTSPLGRHRARSSVVGQGPNPTYSSSTHRTKLHAEASPVLCLCTRLRALLRSVARASMKSTRSLNGLLPTLEPSAWAWSIVTSVRPRITSKRHVLTCHLIVTGSRNCIRGVSSRPL